MILALTVSALCGLAIPPAVDLVTKAHLPTVVKTLLAAVLSAAAGAITTVAYAPGESWTDYALAVLAAFVVTLSATPA
jgi:hypothetical protein